MVNLINQLNYHLPLELVKGWYFTSRLCYLCLQVLIKKVTTTYLNQPKKTVCVYPIKLAQRT
jgi:hypothetical protein